MPLFGKKKDKDPKVESRKSGDGRSKVPPTDNYSGQSPAATGSPVKNGPTTPTSPSSSSEVPFADDMAQTKPKLIFHCQQAHGSPTVSISGFANVKELYAAIAEAFEIAPSDVSCHSHSVILTCSRTCSECNLNSNRGSV